MLVYIIISRRVSSEAIQDCAAAAWVLGLTFKVRVHLWTWLNGGYRARIAQVLPTDLPCMEINIFLRAFTTFSDPSYNLSEGV